MKMKNLTGGPRLVSASRRFPLAKANQQLSPSDFPDFNDPLKLGDGKEQGMMQELLTGRIRLV